VTSPRIPPVWRARPGTHGHRRAFESDRARDARLVAGGYRVLRFTWRQVVRQTLLVTVQIAQALALQPRARYES
jgi:very-short-patch-repair endonuclease